MKKKAKRINHKKFQQVDSEQQLEKSNTLIWGGVLLAIISIGSLIFVLREKLFHLT